MSTPNDTERTELHKTIWRIANDLRGSVDGWDFKSYVLGMLFYRFISENLTAYINAYERRREGSSDFNYADLSDDIAERGRKPMVDEKGFYILPSELFVNVCARARFDDNLNETLHRIFSNIEMSAAGTESERDMKGLFDDMDVNSAKLDPPLPSTTPSWSSCSMPLVIYPSIVRTTFPNTPLTCLEMPMNT